MENTTQEKIDELFKNFSEFLKEKNKRYGDSALSPNKIFCKSDANITLTSRIDEKLNRILNSEELRKNDCIDLLGYLSLLCIQKDWTSFDEFLD